MSSESGADLCRDVQAGQTKHVKEKKEAEVPCEKNRPAGSQRQEEPEAGRPPSPDCDGKQEVTSEGRSERVWWEEEAVDGRMGFSHLAVKRKRQHRGTGLCTVKLHKSKPRSSLMFSHLNKDKQKLPGFFIGGTNGTQIVSRYCESRGWRRVYNTDGKDFRLVWCGKSQTIYSQFKEGQYLLYQIPNNNMLTNKISLLSNLRLHERLSSQIECNERRRRLKMEEFIPTTFRLDMRKERETFFGLFTQQKGKSESRMWICKPSGQNQGKGILLLKNQEDVEAFRLKLQQPEDTRPYLHNQPYIAQHYIQNPLLLESRKFDVRSYLLIACTAPYMVFFRHGYVRLSCETYDPKSENLSTHLTNQYVQKKNPLYSLLKEDTVWSMESFNEYVNHRFQVARGLPRDWVLGALAKRMQQIMTQCFDAVKSKLDRRLGFFDLIGCDFLVDQDFKVWLLEMNCNPSLQTNCEVLKEVIPSTVVETLDLSLEIFNKCRLRQDIVPLTTQQDFVLLYDEFSATLAASCRHLANNKAEPRRCKSDSEGRSAAPASSDNPGGRARPKRSTAVRSPLHLNRVSVGEPVDFHIGRGARAEAKIKPNPLRAAKCLKIQQKATPTDRSSVCSSASKCATCKKRRKKKKRQTVMNENKREKNHVKV